jgi:hypothetical protein
MGAGPSDLPVGQAAARVGVAPSTLRTWGRRYGVVPTGRSSGGHRRYSPADIAVLERMHALTSSGMTPARAAIVALRDAVSLGADPGSGAGGGPGSGEPSTGVAAAGPGGRVLAVPGAGPRAQGLARAASRLDVDGATALLEEALVELGTLATYDALLRPVLVAAGDAWARSGNGIEVEHLFSEAAIEALRHHRRTFRGRTPAGPPVLLACAPGDHHVIPLHVLAGALAERLVPTRILGPRVPPAALRAAVTRTGARTVFVWAQLAGTGLPDVLAAIPARRPPVRVVVGGPGWAAVDLADGVRAAASPGAALGLLTGDT